MNTPRFFALAAVAIVATACADGTPTSPTTAPAHAALVAPASPSLARSGTIGSAVGLTRSAALDRDVTYSFVVTRAGRSVTVPGTGLRISVPAKAIAGKPLTITVTAYAGRTLAYDFEPHGTVFARPLVLTQDLRTTELAGRRSMPSVEAAYFASPSQLDLAANSVAVDEFLPVDADVRGGHLRFSVQHFSGYMLSSGRR
jgi:hypothetical protein